MAGFNNLAVFEGYVSIYASDAFNTNSSTGAMVFLLFLMFYTFDHLFETTVPKINQPTVRQVKKS